MANIVTQRFVDCHNYLKSNGLVKSSRQFALAIDTLPQGLNEILKGNRDVTIKNILNLVSVFNVSESYLISGEGPMFKSETAEIQKQEDKIQYVPTPAYAGNMDQFIEAVSSEDMMRFSIPGYQTMYGEHRCYDVEGDSMEPTLFSGDKIVCSQVPSTNHYSCIKDKYVYVIVTLNEIMVKRVINNITINGTLTIISDNTFYNAKQIPISDVKEIWRVNLKLSHFMTDPSNAKNSLNDQMKTLEDTIRNQALSIKTLTESINKIIKDS